MTRAFLIERDQVDGLDNPQVDGSETLPAAPTGLTASTVSESKISLSWLDNATNEAGYKVHRSTTEGALHPMVFVGLAANQASHVDTGLPANVRQFYRVRAYNGGGDSAFSNEASAITKLLEQGAVIPIAQPPAVPEPVPIYG